MYICEKRRKFIKKSACGYAVRIKPSKLFSIFGIFSDFRMMLWEKNLHFMWIKEEG